MKLLAFLFLLAQTSFAQTKLLLTTDKTSSLIFPFAIRHVDRGTKEVLVQTVKEDERILLVKAASKNFPETNLSVITSDGQVYEFTVGYAVQPAQFVYQLPPKKEATIAAYTQALLNHPLKKIMQVKHGGVTTKLGGLFIKDDVLYGQLFIHNHSPLDFEIDQLRFFLADKKKSKRTSVQENELSLLHQAGNRQKVKAYQFTVIVVALQKFTIPDARYLGIQLMEKNGGRHFNLKVFNGHLLRAKMLAELY